MTRFTKALWSHENDELDARTYHLRALREILPYAFAKGDGGIEHYTDPGSLLIAGRRST